MKVELPYGTIDSNGNKISYVYKSVAAPDVGEYKIEITDSVGELFEIKGTDLLMIFRNYHGYTGYSEEGVLNIGSSYSIYYKKP